MASSLSLLTSKSLKRLVKLDSPFLQLPLLFDAAALAAEIAALPESAWRPHPEGHAGNSALPLIALGGDAANDGVAGAMSPTPHLAQLPYIRQVLASIGAPLGRTRLMRLDGNAEATAHSDVNYYWQDHYRVHVPVVTTPAVRFICGETEVNMAVGECWIFDTTRRHNVINPQPTRRIHLVADTVGSARFMELITHARDPQRAASADWSARRIDFAPQPELSLDFERVNFPTVMSPWEISARVQSVLGAVSDSDAAPIRAALAPVLTEWRAQWALSGDDAAGHAAFEQLRQRARAALVPLRGRVLRAEIDVIDWLEHVALHPALTSDKVQKAHKSTLRHDTQRVREPVFLISPPRSGSTLFFETLAQAPGLATIGGESHGLIENIAVLRPAARDYESNRLIARDADAPVVTALHAAFGAQMRDRNGQPAPHLRLLEKTPKNALRVPFLAAAFPDAQFVYLYRDPRETIASMLDAWQSGRFVTYPNLPDWSGLPWSLLLTPGWRALAGRPLAEVAARQWAATVEQALDDLAALPAQRWCVASYDRLVAEPQAEIERVCTFLDLDFDRTLAAPLPRSRYTLSSPDPDKWKRHAEDLRDVLPYFEPAAQRARAVFAQPPPISPPRRRPATEAPRAPPAPPGAVNFDSVYTDAFPQLLRELGVSLLVSTYQSGRVCVVREDAGKLNTHLRAFHSPMGVALGRRKLAIGTLTQVHEYRNQPAAGRKLKPVGRHDACYLPQSARVTGDIRVHELAYDVDDTLWIVNTRFSCLCTLDDAHSFVPRWRPRFVSALAAEDRCHLNGLALADGQVRYVTALGASDTPDGWRENKADGGALIDVASGEFVARALSMPHSPRIHAGILWLLESGRGEVNTLDPSSGRSTAVAALPGFTRGLTFAGPYAFVGLSKVRESVFDGLPLATRVHERVCGVWVIDTRTGKTAAVLRFAGSVEEIFDVQILPHRYPELAEPDADISANAFVLPEAALAEVPVSETAP
jgi:uncharacterized protein (TIGR03032 family)